MESFELLLKTSCRYHEQFQFTFMVMKVVDSNDRVSWYWAYKGPLVVAANLSSKDIQLDLFVNSRWVSTFKGALSTVECCLLQCQRNITRRNQILGLWYYSFSILLDCLWLSFPVTLILIPLSPLSLLRRISRLYSTRWSMTSSNFKTLGLPTQGKDGTSLA